MNERIPMQRWSVLSLMISLSIVTRRDPGEYLNELVKLLGSSFGGGN